MHKNACAFLLGAATFLIWPIRLNAVWPPSTDLEGSSNTLPSRSTSAVGVPLTEQLNVIIRKLDEDERALKEVMQKLAVDQQSSHEIGKSTPESNSHKKNEQEKKDGHPLP